MKRFALISLALALAVFAADAGASGPDYNSFTAGADSGFTYFGDGSDGDVTIAAGTTTLTRDMYYNNLIVNGTLVPAGFRVFAKTSIVVNGGGVISQTGAAAADAISNVGGTGAAAATYNVGSLWKMGTGGSNGGAGNAAGGANGTASAALGGSAPAVGGAGGNGGTPGGNGAGGGGGTTAANGAWTPIVKMPRLISTVYGIWTTTVAINLFTEGQGGGGGAGGSGNGAATGGGGGGGGAAGGGMLIFAAAITNSGSIEAKGGKGGNGFTPINANSGGGAGGGGGGGGSIFLVYRAYSGTAPSVGGGLGGTHGNGNGTGTNGADGSPGSPGDLVRINLSLKTFE